MPRPSCFGSAILGLPGKCWWLPRLCFYPWLFSPSHSPGQVMVSMVLCALHYWHLPGTLVETPQKEVTSLTPGFWTSSLQNYKRIHFCGFKPPSCGTWLHSPHRLIQNPPMIRLWHHRNIRNSEGDGCWPCIHQPCLEGPLHVSVLLLVFL